MKLTTLKRYCGRLSCGGFLLGTLLIALPLPARRVFIYNASSAGSTVDVIDSATNKVVQVIESIELPHDVAFSADGSRVYISDEAENSLWDWKPIWERLSRRMTVELEPEAAWALDDTGFPKQGDHSVGVDRQYSGTLGKTGNCQVAVSLHHVGAQGSAALNWRLYLPESWIGDPERRAEAGIPDEVEFKKKWQLALEMIDEIREWGLADRIVVADAGYGDATEFRDALETRRLSYALGISSQVGVWAKPPKISIPEYSGRGQPATRYQYGKQRPSSVRDVALQAKGWKKVRWREGSKGWLESRFLAVRVQPSNGFVDGKAPHKEVWLLVQWPEGEREPTRYFLCDLSPAHTLRRLVRIAKSRWKIEQDYLQLKDELGLDHDEGRNWAGWHHHISMVMAGSTQKSFLVRRLSRVRNECATTDAT